MKHYQDLGFAKLDHGRARRRGFPEVVFCENKTTEQIGKIFLAMRQRKDTVLLTRMSKGQFEGIKHLDKKIKYSDSGRIAWFNKRKTKSKGKILVITGGTSDIPVAEEAAITAEVMGNSVQRLYDVGVAGIHRLLANTDKLNDAKVIIVVAGMEGALGSVVSGLSSAPVVAVPTSVGYGSSFKGLSALLTMLNSCSPGIAVVNIDNGFGAGYFASMINKK
ncbi:nickel pincer cofactor biosynthesis protein LarB [Candidatus Woesearchaeota archaeon]|nr:nickel pincer cofactor biosynthesis protein LarB [Candidatus Woesearchaeota archaeon]